MKKPYSIIIIFQLLIMFLFYLVISFVSVGYCATINWTGADNDFRISTTRLATPPPIVILFEANCNNGKVDIAWSSASENNNDYFTIERSTDAINFEAIQTIDGADYSNEPINYSYTDMTSLSGISYYRLKQTDFDGNFQYFNMVSVSCNDNSILPELNVYPNPNDGHFTIDYADLNAQLIIMNSRGEKVADQNSSSVITQMDLSTLSAGIYFLMVYQNGERTVDTKIRVK